MHGCAGRRGGGRMPGATACCSSSFLPVPINGACGPLPGLVMVQRRRYCCKATRLLRAIPSREGGGGATSRRAGGAPPPPPHARTGQSPSATSPRCRRR